MFSKSVDFPFKSLWGLVPPSPTRKYNNSFPFRSINKLRTAQNTSYFDMDSSLNHNHGLHFDPIIISCFNFLIVIWVFKFQFAQDWCYLSEFFISYQKYGSRGFPRTKPFSKMSKNRALKDMLSNFSSWSRKTLCCL